MGNTYEEKKKLIDAAIVVREHCKSLNGCNELCLFYRRGEGCRLNSDIPEEWVLPKLSRWTPEEVSLAKMLKKIGVTQIDKDIDNDVRLRKNDWYEGIFKALLNSFPNLECGEKIDIDDIIKEAEG